MKRGEKAAGALAGGTEIFVRNYDELVKALQDVQSAPDDEFRDIIIDIDGGDGQGFIWPADPVTVTIEIPRSATFSVGDPHFAYTLGTWAIPKNVTIG